MKTHSVAYLKEKLHLFMQYFIPTVRFRKLRYFTDIHGMYVSLCLRLCKAQREGERERETDTRKETRRERKRERNVRVLFGQRKERERQSENIWVCGVCLCAYIACSYVCCVMCFYSKFSIFHWFCTFVCFWSN